MRLTLLLLLIISATRGLLLAPRVAPHVRAAAAAAPAHATAAKGIVPVAGGERGA